jgi:hypothetical protein
MRHRATLVSLLLLPLACSRVAGQAPAPQTAAAKPAVSAEEERPSRKAMADRKVGDFWVHRISGSFSDQAMLLTERVVAKSEIDVTVEYTLEEAATATKLLVWHSIETDDVLEVKRVVDGKEEPGTLADYEGLMAKTALVPDSNEGFVEAKKGTCLVGPSELDCETKSYRVMIGEKSATLDVTQSEKFPGRDISGEISAEDGEVLYRAELLESGHEGGSESSFAAR